MSEREMDLELERVVNAPRAEETETCESWAQNFHMEQRNNHRTRVASKAAYSLLGAVGFFGLWVTELLIWFISLPLFVVFACICSCSVGRLLEMNRR